MTDTMLQTVLVEDELLYLLETLSAKAVWGLDTERLFPTIDLVHEQRLARGLALLKEHGWLMPAAHDTWDMNVPLIQMITAVVDPEIVLTTTYFSPSNTKAVIVYYLAQPLLVELAQLENTAYRLTSLPSLSFLVERLGQSLALPDAAMAVSVQPILVDSVSVAHNTMLRQFLANAHLLAEIEVSRINGNVLLKQIALTLFKTKEGIKLAQYVNEDKQTICFEDVTMASFDEKVSMIIRLLLQINPEIS